MNLDLEPAALAGQIVVGGFDGTDVPERFAKALREKRRAGAILFRRNVPSVEAAFSLCTALVAHAPADLPPFLGVDQEGGRVVRVPPPALQLPPMRALADLGDLDLVLRTARAVAGELSAIGFNLNFAPVLDVNTNHENPIIGDRAFGADARTVMRAGVAYVRGLQQGGVLACGKHFPGHGDTNLDSHLELPVVTHGRGRLDQVELPPFRAAIGAGIATLMTAHIVYRALDADVPATMSRAICASLLRAELGFEGVLFSDDLEMKAIAARWPLAEAAVEAVWAGCDALLICKDLDAQDEVHEALTRQVEKDRRFRDRCVEAVTRGLRVRRLCPPRPVASRELLAQIVGGSASQAVVAAIQETSQRRSS